MVGSKFFKPSGKLKKIGIVKRDMGKRMRGFNPLGDREGDSKLNLIDCKPLDSKKQDIKSFAQAQFQVIREQTAAFNKRRDERIAARVEDLEIRTALTVRRIEARRQLTAARQGLRLARGESLFGQGIQRAGLAIGRATVRAAPGFEEFIIGVRPRTIKERKPTKTRRVKRRKKRSR